MYGVRQQCRATTNQYQTLPAWRPVVVVALQLCVTQTFPASLLVPGVCVPAPTHSPCPGPCPAPGRGRRRGGWRAGGWAAACWAALCPLVSQVTVLCRYSGHGGACSSTDLPPAAVLTRPARHQSPLGLRPRHLHHHHLLLLLGSNKHCLPDIIYRAMPMVQTVGPCCLLSTRQTSVSAVS